MKRMGVILAGGAGARMGGRDKGAVKLAGRRLVDHVTARFTPQIDQLLIAGPNNYGVEAISVDDRADGPKGPAAGLWAIASWLVEHEKSVRGFVTAPVDGPLLPEDLYARLSARGDCAIATDENGAHPTYAHWVVSDLMAALSEIETGEGAALRQTAEKCSARPVFFQSSSAFMNINRPEDLAHAEAVLRQKDAAP